QLASWCARKLSTRVRFEVAGSPFPNVADHVISTGRRRAFERTHVNQSAGRTAAGIRHPRIPLCAPRISTSVSATGGEFPLLFSREPFAGPRCEGHRVVPRNVANRL